MRSNRFYVALLAVAVLAAGAASLKLASTGSSMTAAAEKFVATLSPAEKAETVLPYDGPARTDWHYIPKATRKGLQVKNMSEAQRKAAFNLLDSALSSVGYKKARKVMQLESILHELEKNRQGGAIRDAERYYFTLFGDVAGDGPWGLSVEGHHLSLNFVVENDKVVSSTPTFYGANPGILLADYGEGFPKGLRVLKDEEQLAFDLLDSLDEQQRAKAIVADKAPSDVRDAGKASPPISPAAGLPAAEMTPKQVSILRSLIEAYAHNLPDDVAQERLSRIEKDGYDAITFAWAGADRPGVGHDYRVQGESFLIEFNNTQPDSAGNPANHVHSVWHNLEGNFALPVAE
ncbi:MAG: DUF3500 domain-containing protein [Planctomycetota bacterium]|nr:MAG: DUF3500 domain-containing protein [Planctomycetota bacterium]